MRQTDEAIPLKVLEMAIVMVNAADQCDQAGQWDRDHRRACRHILDWYNSNDYKITCDKAGVKDAPPKSNADRIRQMTDEELVALMPTIEPEVRHGLWKKKNGEIYCTNCKKWKWSESFELMLRRFNFCPNCGADMREEGYENG